ncbi:MAG: 3-methyl-2-oxobutanoate hydroxymethyltransferase [Wenzhouxiangellaceae bacterium]|nr:3-methyl-2-oxobutanoate hydroxymethyltransferase [Wenzhouxiangellaceae bacterium]
MKSGKVTLRQLAAMKRERTPLTMLTAYDAGFARVLDAAGIDCVLVGDSLGNVIQGRETTVPVTLEDMIYHVTCVRRGLERALLVADLPFLTYADVTPAIESARALMQAGAEMVKIEGGRAVVPQVRALASLGVPVCGHVGLTPQSVHQLSGFRVQGRGAEARERLLEDARALEEAGAGLLVVECVPEPLGRALSETLTIPVIGIGAGRGVDGQVLVLHDLLGMDPGSAPRFARDFLSGADGISGAVSAYVSAVRDGRFPADDEVYAE